MKRLAIVVSVLSAILFTSNSFAQSNNKWKMQLGYNVSTPLGSFKNNYISNTSFRGGVGEISYTVNPKVSVGLASGYQDYYQKYSRAVYHTQGNEVVSAVISNSMQVVPILLKGTFSPMGSTTAAIKPYLSAGAGINLVDYKQYLGEFPTSDAAGVFAAQAGLGVMVPFNKNNAETGFKLGGTYNYAAYKKNGLSNLSSVGVNAGVVFNLK